MEDQFPYLMMNENKINSDESSDSPEKESKYFKYKSFAKFKPKSNNSSNIEEDKKSLKGAENKVKLLLSDYLKNIELEKKGEYHINLKFNNKHLGTCIIPGKKKKRLTNITKKRFKELNDIENNNKNSTLIFDMNTTKINKNKYSGIVKGKKGTFLSKHKSRGKNKDSSLLGTNIKTIKNAQMKEKSNTKIKKISNTLINKNVDKDSSEFLKSESFKQDYSNKSDLGSIKSLLSIKDEGGAGNNFNQKLGKDELFSKILHNNHKSRNELFNESCHNSIISEGSNCYINQKSIDIQNKVGKKRKVDSSNRTLNNNLSLFTKNNQIEINQKKNKSSSNMYELKKEKMSKFNDRNKSIKDQLLKKNPEYKSLKEQLRKTLSLRQEEIHTPQSENRKFTITSNSNHSINNMNKTMVRNKNLQKINKNINSINLGYISKKELVKKNNSYNDKKDKSNILLSDINNSKKEEKTKNNNIENESEQTLKTTKTKNIDLTKTIIVSNIHSNTLQNKSTLFAEKYRNLIHKNNLYDSLDDEEIDDGDDGFYLDPNSKFILIFDSILFISSMISFLETPFYLAINHDFCKSKKLTIIGGFNIITELIYILDLILGFFRGYYNWEEQLVTKKRYILKKYLTDWFIFDLISAIPIYILHKMHEPLCNDYELSTTYYNNILDNLSYLLICNKLFKVYKIHVNNQAVKVYSNKINDFWSMFYTVVFVVGALNYSACLYIFIARNCYPNWILNARLGTESFSAIYICSIYILIMALTTVGYGDITCYSFHERIYQMFLLVVGIMAYSYAVSAFSNFVQKINDKSADFEKKKSILDEIKLSNPNLPDELYERILKHLIYKNTHEKKLKNVLFDGLPLTLKNNLISEMYKPIIKSFIFFKNFQNTDFIVRVILAFKSIMAYKNDILVNEGDMVEEILFVKKGVLSLEIPINLTNPQENIDKYLNAPLLKINDFEKVIDNENKKKQSSVKSLKIFDSTIDNPYNMCDSPTHKKKTVKEKEKVVDKKKYVKILSIRSNEHFGDVLMFLEQRSPLRIRVRTKKCELFFLKKIDAIKISTIHQNIWRRLNKKSIYNFEQIKKIIKRIVEIYCSIKDESNETDKIYEELISKTKIEKRKKLMEEQAKNNLNFQIIPKKEINIKRSISLNFKKRKYFQNLFKDKNINMSLKEFKENHKYFSFRNSRENNKYEEFNDLINNINIKSSLSSKKNKIKNENKKSNEKKLIDSNNEVSKFNKDLNMSTVETNKINKNLGKDNIRSKLNYSIPLISVSKKSNNSNNLNNITTSSKTIKLNDSDSIKIFDRNNDELIDNNNESESNRAYYGGLVNKEIYPGEEIIIRKESNSLFKKRFNSSYPKLKVNNDIYNEKYKYKNNKLKKLLREESLIDDDEEEAEGKKKFNRLENENKDFNKGINNEISERRKNRFSESSQTYEKETKRKIFKQNLLSINKNISFVYESCYENCNLITGEKLIKNKIFQEKLKKFLLNEVLGLSFNMDEKIKKINSYIESNIHATSETNTKVQSLNQPEKKENTKVSQSLHNSPILKPLPSKKYRRSVTLFDKNQETPKIKKCTPSRRLSLNEKFKSNFEDGINDSNNLSNKKSNLKRRISAKNILSNKIKSSKDLNRRNFMSKKNLLYLSPNLKLKRHQDNILSQIDLNIEKTNQNLNNPEEFYSNYFNYLLGGKKDNDNNDGSRYSGYFGPPTHNLESNSKLQK